MDLLNVAAEPVELLSLTDVGLRFGPTPILDRVNLAICAGEFVSLVGVSGSGKSTLLRVMAGLASPTEGRAALGYRDINTTRHEGSHVGFVFQAPTLLPWRTALGNVLLALELERVGQRERRQRAVEALTLARLAPTDFDKLPHQLSGGMQMRVSLARAIVTRPRLLLLDEPFAALDDLLRQELNEEVLSLWSNLGLGAVLVTHNIAEATFVSQRVLLLGGHPATIAHELEVPFPYPRRAELRGTPEFAALTSRILALLQQGDQP